MSISTTIKSIQDIMRKDVGVDGDAQRIGQLVWMFFLKIYDDKETEYELFDDHYKSPIPERLRWRNWAADAEGMTGDELLDFVDKQLFPTLKNLQPKGNDKRGFVIRGVFEDAYNYMKSGHLMRQVINKIVEGIDFNKAQDRHLFGDLYEQILRDLQNAGNAGEYYTPRPVTQFMVDMTAPQLGEKIMDPACGTGGFLTCAIEYVRKHHVKTVEQEQLLQQSIFGVEKKPLPHLLCTTNMILHGIDVPTNVRHDNTLARPLRDYSSRDRVDVILTNPPFGGMEEDGIENNFPATFRTRETADLFLVLIMHLLKDGGRAAVVLPDGTLFGEGIKTRIKEQLLETCNLHTVVRLPNGVFSPYTGIKTNLLFFTKGTPTQDVWFYEHPYPPGYKNYSKTKPMRIEEFAAEKAWWGDRVENEFAWKVSVDDIKARNYNLDIKNPHSPDQVSHDSEELLADYAQLQERIAKTRDELKSVLAAALEADATLNWDLLAEHFDTLFVTESNVDALEQTILQMAVMGKLVPQNSNDESASDLLKRISHERVRLEAKGAFRKSKATPVSVEEHLFDSPQGWAWVRLTQLGEFRSGKTPSTNRSEYWDGEIPWVSPKDMKSLVVSQTEDYVSDLAVSDGLSIIPASSVLIVVRSGILRRTVPVAINSLPCTVNQDLKALCLVLPGMERYIQLLIRGFERLILETLTKVGTTVESIKFDEFSQQPFPLPPLAEQRRIVDKVDELTALCHRLKADLAESRNRQARLASTLIESALKGA